MVWTLDKLIQDLVSVDLSAIEVKELTVSSDEVEPGSVFIALKGSKTHGLNYADTAVARGAVAVLYEPCEKVSLPDVNVPLVAVEQLKAHLGQIASKFYFSETSAPIIGITGTDGKTTTAYLIAQLLQSQGKRVGIIGTLGFGLGAAMSQTKNTTPDVVSVHRMTSALTRQGADVIVMEVSSHGLSQGRVDSVKFTGAVFTNLGEDHLDFHGTVENYAKAKKMLFEKPMAFAVFNLDDDQADYMQQDAGAECKYFISVEDKQQLTASLSASNVVVSASKTAFEIHSAAETFQCESALVGLFNVYNLLSAIMVAKLLGENLEDLCRGLAKLKSVPGRMERYTRRGQPTVIVDFAHTPEALEKVLSTLRQLANNKIYVVFGCGGDRDKTKREKMGRVAASLADSIILTDDNPRSESGDEIISAIQQGIPADKDVVVQRDRLRAIELGIASAGVDDIVLIAGKGHESYQEIAGEKQPFSDRDVVSQLVEAA